MSKDDEWIIYKILNEMNYRTGLTPRDICVAIGKNFCSEQRIFDLFTHEISKLVCESGTMLSLNVDRVNLNSRFDISMEGRRWLKLYREGKLKSYKYGGESGTVKSSNESLDYANFKFKPHPEKSVTEQLSEIVNDAIVSERYIRRNNIPIVAKRYEADVHCQMRFSHGGKNAGSNNFIGIYYLTTIPIGYDEFYFGTNITSDKKRRTAIYRNSYLASLLQQHKVDQKFHCSIKMAGHEIGKINTITGLIDNTVNYETRSINAKCLDKEVHYNTLKEYLEAIVQNKNGKKPPSVFCLRDYIHKQVELAFHPVIDDIQSEIKYENLYYDGRPIIISGGPGTGKTTTMVGRLKYLTDEVSIREDGRDGYNKFKLSAINRKELLKAIQANRDWLFFSPSPLLCDYLAHAMESEDMQSPRKKTRYWEEFRSKMMSEYGFTDKFTLSSNNELLYLDEVAILKSFTEFFLDYFRTAQNSLPKYKLAGNSWGTLAYSIERNVKELSTINSISDLIDKLRLLERNYSEQCKEALKPYETSLTRYVTTLKGKLEIDNEDEVIAIIDTFTDETKTAKKKTDEEKIKNALSEWISEYVKDLDNEQQKHSESYLLLNEIFEPLLDDTIKQRLLDLLEGDKLRAIASFTQGETKLLTTPLVRIYKDFRKNMLANKSSAWNLDLLSELSNSKKKELHYQEQSLLLGFANNLAREIIKKNSGDGLYVTQYKEHARPIIGIDEVADFSPIEVYAMTSFRLDNLSAIVLAGDLLQRMTSKGLKSWDDLDPVLPNKIVKSLKTSYRQSKKMLNVAQQLYKETMHEVAPYSAYLKEDRVPEPLGFISEYETEKTDWIVERIRELYKVYGELPSIAIFLNNRDEVSAFANKLAKYEFFKKERIHVIDGTDGSAFGKTGQVRVFPLEIVKGMEFDAVFFHNIDDTSLPEDLIKSYMYVGVSRASFYLGATFKTQNERLSKYFTFDANWKEQ